MHKVHGIMAACVHKGKAATKSVILCTVDSQQFGLNPDLIESSLVWKSIYKNPFTFYMIEKTSDFNSRSV